MIFTIRNYQPEDIDQLITVQKSYKSKYEDYIIRDGAVYTEHPVFEQGKNILCAVNTKGEIVACGPIVPAPVLEDSPLENEHYLWTDIIYDPFAEDLRVAQTLLLEQILRRAEEIKANWCSRPSRLAVLKFSEEAEGLDFFKSQGFESFEEMYWMQRDLSKTIHKSTLSDQWTLKHYRPQSEEEKAMYIQADNLSNPNSPMSLEKLDWFLENCLQNGSAIGAFDKNGELLGSVMAYWFDNKQGVTEEIFVVPHGRRKGIAEALVSEALCFLKEKGLQQAELEVRKSNTAAVALYEKTGYEISKLECSLGRYI